MTNQPRPMSATARAVLSLAATRDDHLVALPRLPVAAARQIIRSMLNAGLVEELSAAAIDPGYVWRAGEDGEVISLRATALGLARVEGSARAAIASVSAETAGGAAAEIGVPAETDPKVRVTALMPASEDMPATTAQTSQGAQERPDDANLGDDTAPVLTQGLRMRFRSP